MSESGHTCLTCLLPAHLPACIRAPTLIAALHDACRWQPHLFKGALDLQNLTSMKKFVRARLNNLWHTVYGKKAHAMGLSRLPRTQPTRRLACVTSLSICSYETQLQAQGVRLCLPQPGAADRGALMW